MGIEGFVTVLGVVNGPAVTRRFAGVVRPVGGPTREALREGVTLPVGREGVTRPVEIEGVTLPEKDGVIRPLLLRTEATEAGREMVLVRTAGRESLSTATNTPHFGGQTKYLVLIRDVDQDRLIAFFGGTAYPFTLPSFFPLPANPPPSSTPAHSPGLPSIGPMKRRTPSNPKDSILASSPISNCLPARLTLRP